MESSSIWLKVVCEGDEKSVKAFSEIFSYYVATLPLEYDLFEEAIEEGAIVEDSTDKQYLLELYGTEVVESFFQNLSFGIREIPLFIDREGRIGVMSPIPIILGILYGEDDIDRRLLKLTCMGDEESLNLIKTYFRNAVKDLDFKRDERSKTQHILELEEEEVINTFLLNLLNGFELPLKRGGRR